MAVEPRNHVPLLAGVLSAVSLALVFGAVLGALPVGALPRADDALLAAIPHLNAGISLAAVPTIVSGWLWIRAGRVHRHRAAMISASILFAAFLVLYLYKVAISGPTEFPGPATIYRFVYLPLLAVHVLLAVVCIPLLYYVLLIGLTHPIPEIPRTRHPAVGRVAASLWLVSFGLGLVVYLLLYRVY